MNIFSSTDKIGPSFDDILNDDELDLVDLEHEFQSSHRLEKAFFGLFSQDEVEQMLDEAKIFTRLKQRGYSSWLLEVDPISDLDNRIYIRNQNREILLHMRLKLGNLTLAKLQETHKLVYIDWLLSQNVNYGKMQEKKKLFEGQEYPGLNIMKEVTHFISTLMVKVGANGAFNVPEYFHDAVLFHKNFRFVNPQKEGSFRKLLYTFRKYSLRRVSQFIHEKKIYPVGGSQPYEWKYGEMLHTKASYLLEKLFDEQYHQMVDQAYEENFELRE